MCETWRSVCLFTLALRYYRNWCKIQIPVFFLSKDGDIFRVIKKLRHMSIIFREGQELSPPIILSKTLIFEFVDKEHLLINRRSVHL